MLESEISVDARDDLVLSYQWYLREAGLTVAERYLDAFSKTVALLSREPGVGQTRHFRSPRLKGIRSMPLHGAFKVHLIFFRVEGEVLDVFRMLHGMRDLPRRLLQPPGADD